MEKLKVGSLLKHFKGTNLIEKNIYKVIATNVAYTGENADKLQDLVVYESVFQKGKVFVREYEDLLQELSEEKQKLYNQKYRVECLTEEEIETVKSEKFKEEKMKYLNEKYK